MAKGIWSFLRIFNDHMMQPLLTVSTSKGIKIKEALIFLCKEDIILKCFKEISHWLLKDWCPYAKKLPMNKHVSNKEVIDVETNENIYESLH